MGFDPGGHVVNYEALATPDAGAQRHAPSAKQICDQSAKMLTFYDLAGHEKYLKTTVLGMTGAMPDYACIVVSANNGVQRMTKEHLGLCLALAIPFFVVVTRVDMTPEPVTKHTTETIAKLLKHPDVRKLPFPVRRAEDAVVCAKNVKDGRIAPVFHVSSVTGAGLGLLQRFLNLLPVRRDWRGLVREPLEVLPGQRIPQSLHSTPPGHLGKAGAGDAWERKEAKEAVGEGRQNCSQG